MIWALENSGMDAPDFCGPFFNYTRLGGLTRLRVLYLAERVLEQRKVVSPLLMQWKGLLN